MTVRLAPALPNARQVGSPLEQADIDDSPRHAAAIAWRRYAVAGYALIIAAFGVTGAWGALVHLDRAVISPGVLVAESNRKTVQHFEGGMVQNILVKDGQVVRSGDVLLRIDPLQSEASADLFRNQLDAALVLEARLRAEQDQTDSFKVPAEIAARRNEPALARIIRDQTSQLTERKTTLQGQLSLIDAKVTQLKTEISGIAVEKAAVEQQVKYIRQELDGLRSLQGKNLIPVSRLLAMERERTRLEGVIGRSVADTAKAQNAISETGLQSTQLRQRFQEGVTAQLLEARQKIGELREKLIVAQDVYRRHEIRASQQGVIQGLKVHSIGQVIRSGEPLMEIVPTSDRLVINVQFSPNDLETVRSGMRAEIKFPSFQTRRTPTVFGTLTTVSRDRLIDDGTKQPYFAGIVAIDDGSLPDEVKQQLIAGLPAEVVVSAGERTALQYLFAPFFDAMGRAFHER
ncbi:HlyD family type I secretion periplasmic adaptor subunit [Methylobacterium gnaphalii]|uniref:Membrane fusion protein (MFP) family protein n=1 Tax=Methylobacterium gnaphalii TaxID=1010610 RepID=A0A512JS64_9HYPH|nr:HlyD family type I secretion periplasmic adaptor subunit [Methylobacterium gnaphalii]GEP12733.1 RsaA secretion system, membrane protein RsaE [Methylobacterium gnaphalii]GJD71210.1 Type I secretion system membrane fusion protein PrsE [Methylobacterium gnaphalii]GLS51340.1 RsaA secretion system, membrane protein RsaE [Methylobacterium gnaphalii]